jgi:hypothetical protein
MKKQNIDKSFYKANLLPPPRLNFIALCIICSSMVFEAKAQSACNWSPTSCTSSLPMHREGAVGIGTSLVPTIGYIFEVEGNVNFINATTRIDLFGNSRLLHSNNNFAENLYLGLRAGQNNTAPYNTFVGAHSGSIGSGGTACTFLGYRSGAFNNGDANTFVGSESGTNNHGGQDNTFVGNRSGALNISGRDNCFYGSFSGIANDDGDGNSYYGFYSGALGVTSEKNCFYGFQSGFNNLVDFNSFFGYNSGYSNSTGGQNVFIGYESGFSNTTGHNNLFLGTQAGLANVSGIRNTYLGSRAGFSSLGSDNVSIGHQANSNAGGTTTTSSHESIYIGNFSCPFIDGDGNVGIGFESAFQASGTTYSTMIGWKVAPDLVDGQDNVFIGNEAAIGFTGENSNVAIGARTELQSGGGGEITLLGYQAIASGNITNATAIGANAEVCDDNTLVLGFSDPSATPPLYTNVVIGECYRDNTSDLLQVWGDVSKANAGPWSGFSDSRLKKNINDFSLGLETLVKINSVTYNFDKSKINISSNEDKVYVGIIAQDLLKIDELAPYTISISDKSGYYKYDPNALLYLLINSVKEQQNQIDELKNELAEKANSNKTQNDKNNSQLQNNILNQGKLYQNRPNPFENTTEIPYLIEDYKNEAKIAIFDMNGYLVKEINQLQKGEQMVTVNLQGLKPGIYAYTLIVDGVSIDTKTMVLSR